MGENLELMIKNSKITPADQELLRKIIGHGKHLHFEKINVAQLEKIIARYVFSLNTSLKGTLREHESAFYRVKIKFDETQVKVDKIRAKLEGKKK